MAKTPSFIRWHRLHGAHPKRNGCPSVLGFGPFRTTCAHTVYPQTVPFPPSPRSCPTATTKLMATSSQGASGPSGFAGLLRTSVQPVSENPTVSGSVLTRLEQPLQERLISNEIRKLTVSFSSMRSTSALTDCLTIQGRIPGTAHGMIMSL